MKKIVEKPITKNEGKWRCLVCKEYFDEPKKNPKGKLICPLCKCDCVEKIL